MSEVLIPMKGYNLYRAAPADDQDRARYTNCELHPVLTTLISELALKRPKWTYVATGWGTGQEDGSYRVDALRICEDGQALGTVQRSYFRGVCYGIDNARMRNKRARGNETRTKDLKKAVKHILTNFYALTPAEMMDKATRGARDRLSDERNKRDRALSYAKDGLKDAAFAFIFERWDEFASRPIPVDAVRHRDTILSARDAKAEISGLVAAWDSGAGSIVATTERAYHVKHRTNDYFSTYVPEEVPVDIRSAIGILKLIEPGQFISDVGMRVDTNTFFIIQQT